MPEWIVRLIVALGSTLAGTYFVYRLGLRSYTKQKEHELIIQRYLENGIDQISANLDLALGIYRENWWNALSILKQFREYCEMDLPIPEELYSFPFKRYEPESFTVTPFYRIQSLVEDKIFWDASQDLYVFVDYTAEFFEKDLCSAIRTYVETNKIEVSHNVLVSEYRERVRKFDEQSQKYYLILTELQNLSLILEAGRLSFEELHELKHRPRVRERVRRFKKEFEGQKGEFMKTPESETESQDE